MKASPESQALLLEVQAVDTRIARSRHRKGSLAEHAEIAKGKSEWARLGERIVAADTEISDTEVELEQAEGDLVPVRERIARDVKRVDDGVLGPKELPAMLAEIEHLKKRISDLEDVQLEIMERLEDATARKVALAADKAERERTLKALMVRRDGLVAGFDAELADAEAERARLTADVPADLLALYDRIRERNGGVGAAKLEGKRCSGCQLEATPSALTHYRDAPADEVLRCEECDRVLVR